jgi:aryl-alcohol dehydrogenase-like predicted oxidoreductase
VVARSNTLAETARLDVVRRLQVEYSLIERAAERELLPMAHALGLGVMAWSPLASGILSGKYGATAAADGQRLQKVAMRTLDERSLAIAAAPARSRPNSAARRAGGAELVACEAGRDAAAGRAHTGTVGRQPGLPRVRSDAAQVAQLDA